MGKPSKFKGIPRSEETKEKIRIGNIGKKMSEDQIAKITISKTGDKNPNFNKHFSTEHKKKIGDAQRGNKNHLFGKNHTEETKEKIRKSRLGVKMSEETKRKQSETKRRLKIERYSILVNSITSILLMSQNTNLLAPNLTPIANPTIPLT
jgi:hypothetical protein